MLLQTDPDEGSIVLFVSFVLKSGGASIKYPNIRVAQSNLFLNDGVHLFPLGNHVFVYTLQAAIQHFSTCRGISLLYPQSDCLYIFD